ncbi:MAG: CmcI family methyltransferase [Syntrophorhabdaceae bacterium]
MGGIVKEAKRGIRKVRKFLDQRTYGDPVTEKDIVARFHKLYYDAASIGKTWKNTRWLGVYTQKCPLDLWIYQETLWETRPDVIVECGTAEGGTTLYLASMCDLLGTGRIVSVDIDTRPKRPSHPRITYIGGSSIAPEVVAQVKKHIKKNEKVMVILDSDHNKKHVDQELKIYSNLVSMNCYLNVEDSNVNGHPVLLDHGPGPMEAIDEFLAKDDRFVIDEEKEKFLMTFNPRGYLKRVK